MKSVTRILLLLMTMLIVVSPSVSAQATPEAVVEESIPAIDDTAGDDGQQPADIPASEGTPPPSSGDEGEADAHEVAPSDSTRSRQAEPGFSIQSSHEGTIVVNVVGSDSDQPVPTNALVCISVIWNCVPWTGTPLTFTVPEGTYTVSFDQFDESYYTDTNTTVTVGAGETLDVTLTLEPRQPSTLRLYVSTDTGVPIPAGTEACVSQEATAYTDAVDTCEDMTGLMFADFAVNEGWVDINVTTPADSGFAGATDTIWVPGGTVYRDYLVLEDDADASITIDVATEDGLILNAAPEICFQHASEPLENCAWVGNPDFDNDGGGNYTFRVPAGTWTWAVAPSSLDISYLPVSGTVTVGDGDELVIEALLPLRTEADRGIVSVDVWTFDEGDVPEGTEICVTDALGGNCETWAGDTVQIDVAAGPVMVEVIAPGDSGYTSYMQYLPMVETGEERMVSAVLYPLDTPLTVDKTVSDSAPESGDTVTYRIHAYGPAYEFLIEDVLPGELSEITVTCEGAFLSELPGACYEIYEGIVVVPGIAGNETFMDITLEITGVVTGEPETEVTNVACVTSFVWTGDEIACDAAELVVAETVVTPEPSVTPDSTATPDPDPTGTPVVTPEPTHPTPSETPGAVETPAAGEQPGAPVTKLPNTGRETTSASPAQALMVALIAGAALAGAGALRLRGASRG